MRLPIRSAGWRIGPRASTAMVNGTVLNVVKIATGPVPGALRAMRSISALMSPYPAS